MNNAYTPVNYSPAYAPVRQKSPVKGVIGGIFAAIGRLLRNLLCGVLNPKKWITIILIAGLSTLLNWLISSGELNDLMENPLVAKLVPIVSYILYAGGGVSKNIPEVLSGSFAKIVCAGFLAALFSGKLKGTGKGLKLFMGSLVGKYAKPARALMGIGLSFIIYSWAAGNSGLSGTMVGISGTLMILRALGGAPGILRNLSASFNSYKSGNERRADLTGMNAFLAGAAGGFALSCLLCLKIDSSKMIIAGLVLFVAGFVFKLFSKKSVAAVSVLILLLATVAVPSFAFDYARRITNPPTSATSGQLSFNYCGMNGQLSLIQGGAYVTGLTSESCIEIFDDGNWLYQRFRGDLHPGQTVEFSLSSQFPHDGSKTINSNVYFYGNGEYLGDTNDCNYYNTGKYAYTGSEEFPWLDIGYDYSFLGNVDGIWLAFLFSYSDSTMYEVDIMLGNVPDDELEWCTDYDIGDIPTVEETEYGEEIVELPEVDGDGFEDIEDDTTNTTDYDDWEDYLDYPQDDYYDDYVYDDFFTDGSYPEGFSDLSPEEAATLSAVVGVIAIGIGAGAVTTVTSGTGSSAGGNSGPSYGDTYTLTDPATGAQSLYNYDPSTGEWVSDDGRSVLNIDDVPRWQSDRMADRAAADQTADAFANRTDWYSQRGDAESARLKEERKKIEEESKIEKTAIRNGFYATTKEELGERLARLQEQNLRNQANAYVALAHKENLVKAAEITKEAADFGVEVLSKVTGPNGTLVKNLYYGGRALASNLTDAVVNNKDMGSAWRKAIGETVVDVTQNMMGSKSLGYQFAANSVGDAYKAALDAVDSGKDPVQAAVSGFVGGSAKTGMGVVFDKYVDAKNITSGSNKTVSLYSQHLQYNAKVLNGLRENFEAGRITKTVYEGARDAVRSSSATTGRLIKAASAGTHYVTDKLVDAGAGAVTETLFK